MFFVSRQSPFVLPSALVMSDIRGVSKKQSANFDSLFRPRVFAECPISSTTSCFHKRLARALIFGGLSEVDVCTGLIVEVFIFRFSYMIDWGFF